MTEAANEPAAQGEGGAAAASPASGPEAPARVDAAPADEPAAGPVVGHDAAPQAPSTAEPDPKRAPEPQPDLHFGQQIARAREAAGMTVATLAAKLRIHARQIDAIERADVALLPARSYARGFVRACARELRIDPLPLLADLDARMGPDPAIRVPPQSHGPRFSSFGENTRPVVLALLALLVVAGVVGWLVPHHPHGSGAGASSGSGPTGVVANGDASGAAPSMGLASGNAATSPAPTASAPAEVAPPTLSPPAVAPGPSQGVAISQSAPTAPAPAAPAVAAAASATGNAVAARPAAAIPVAADEARLELEFDQAAWVQVVREDGSVIFQQLCAAGSKQVVVGRPPMTATIGNANAVRARYRGKELDLAKIAGSVGVAKLNLP